MLDIKGIYPALLTPFDNDGRINEKALTDLVNLLLSQGVKGFYINGSTAECHLMDLSERMLVSEIVRSLTKDKAVVIEHVGTPGTELSARLARHAAKIGVDVISAIPPFFYKYSFDEILEHYRYLTQVSGLPMIIYHFPALSGVSFTVEDLKRFREIGGIIGVKYTSPDLFTLSRMRQAYPDLVFFNGHDEIFISALAIGVDGAIGSTFNFMYKKAVTLKKLFDEKRIDEARAVQISMNGILSAVLNAGNFQGSKYLMKRYYGIDCGICRKPMRPISAESMSELDKILPLLD